MAEPARIRWLPVSKDVKEILEKLERVEERPPCFYERFSKLAFRALGRLTANAKLTEDTLRTLSLADLRVKPSEWWAGFFLSMGLPVGLLLGVWGLQVLLGTDPWALWYFPLLGLCLGTLSGGIFYAYPHALAELKRTEAQSKAIETVMLLSFALYHSPDLRGATVFAADKSEGRLAEDLQRGLLDLDGRRKYESVRHLLTLLAHRWGEVDEGTRRAFFDILRSTGQSEEAARLQDIAKAPHRVLEASELQLRKRLSALVSPTMAFMVFGSLAILASIGLSPIFGMVGLGFIDLRFFALTAGVLCGGFLLFTVYMGRRRPATVPPPKVPPEDPRLPPKGKVKLLGHALPSWLLPALVFVALAWPGALYLLGLVPGGKLGAVISGFNTFWMVWACAAALGVYALLRSRPLLRVREEERKNLEDWETAFNTIGSRMLDGKPMSQAMLEASKLMRGSEVAKQLEQASSTAERMSSDLGTILGRGLFKRVYSPLVKSFLTVIARIRTRSEEAAGRACMTAGDFLSALRRVEIRFKERMDEVLGNLWMVVILLLPVVCAMSVWVMEFMSDVSLRLGAEAAGAGLRAFGMLFGALEPRELAWLRLVMGVTSLTLALIMARFIAVIRGGRDEAEFWGAIAKTSLASTAVFTLAYAGFSLMGMV